ncbi:tetratricopeptide repeat protein [Candidatus Mcinerneyibacteriota bacterium]|nr:tetratricopeptide repeat protein [Candidatus Mcinerneyibacteriota bacterium]
MDQNLCPFLNDNEGKPISCMKKECFLYDAPSQACIFQAIDLHNKENVTKLGKLIKKSSNDNGILIKKIGTLLNNGMKPMMEFFKVMDNGKKIEELIGLLSREKGGQLSEETAEKEPFALGGLENALGRNTEILLRLQELLGEEGPLAEKMGEAARAALDMKTSLEEMKAGLKTLPESSGEEKPGKGKEDYLESMKLLLDTLKKPLAATLKIQKESYDRLGFFSETAGEAMTALHEQSAENKTAFQDLARNVRENTETLQNLHQEGPLYQEARQLNEKATLYMEQARETAASQQETSLKMLESLEAIRLSMEGLGQKLEQLEKRMDHLDVIREGMDICVESQQALSRSFVSGMEKMEAFAVLQKEYLQNEESAIRMKKADDLNNTGLTFLMNGELSAAIDCFKEAITLNNRLWGAYSNLGLAFSEKGEKEKAKDVFKKLIKLNPEFSESYYNLGMILVEEDFVEKAVPLFRKSIEKRPDFAKAYVAMGNALYELDRIEFAVKAWEKAVALDPTLDETKEQLMKLKELGELGEEEE